MAHPYHHALSSSRLQGGDWISHYPIHAFLDSSKAHLADARHRSLFHNPTGLALCEKIPLTIPKEKKRSIAEQHIQEDIGKIPLLQEWIAKEPPFKANWDRILGMPKKEITRITVDNRATSPQNHDDLAQILEILLMPESQEEVINHPSRAIYLTSPGPFLCEFLIGPVAPCGIPTRTLAEGIIKSIFGKIPSCQDFLKKSKIKTWMYKKASPLSKTLYSESVL